jgi:hypothetical protein
MAEPNEVIRCEHCGFESERYKEALALKEDALRDAENELRAKRGIITRLKKSRDARPELDPHAAEAQAIFDYWRSRLAPSAREFTGKRWENVIARLRAGHSVDEIKRAIDGCALRPYVTNNGREAEGKSHQRQVDLELICRDESKLLRFASYADAAEQEKPDADLVPQQRVLAMQRLIERPTILHRLGQLRGWHPKAVLSLGLGLDGDRIVFFVRDADGRLVGMHRYQPNPERRNGKPKQIAAGARELFPRPEEFGSSTIWLVEGEPDAVAICSAGLPGVAVPGVATWKKSWTERFEGFERVFICFDCDKQGREAAQQRADQLRKVTDVTVVDLDPARQDGYDLGDLLLEKGDGTASALASLATVSTGATDSFQPTLDFTPPYEKLTTALRNRGLKVNERSPGHASSQCPNHEDRHPSLSVSQGDDGRVLVHCHTGCTPEEIVGALGLHLRDLFPRS